MSNPLVLLLAWIGSTVLAAALTGWGCYVVGYDRCERDQDRHRHRIGDPVVAADLPRSGPLTPLPGFDWSFFGGAQLEVPPGPAEYDLLTNPQTIEAAFSGYADAIKRAETELSPQLLAAYGMEDLLPEPCESPGCTVDETPSDFTRRMVRDVDRFIAQIEGDTNYWLHTYRPD
jgi:hypothetical protein